MTQITIDNREADEREAEILRELVRRRCRTLEHDKPIRHISWDYARQLAKERGFV